MKEIGEKKNRTNKRYFTYIVFRELINGKINMMNNDKN